MEKRGGVLLREVNVEGEQGQGERSPCCCQGEIKSLQRTVEQLRVQIEKQSDVFQRKQDEMIAGMKTCVRNVALALLTFSQENETDADGRHRNPFSDYPAQASGPAAVDTELLKNSGVAISRVTRSRSPTQDNLQDGKDVSPLTNADDVLVPIPVIVASVSLETSSNEQVGQKDTFDHVGDDYGENHLDFQGNQDEVEAGSVFCQKFEQTENDVNFEDELGDSFDAHDENEDEAMHENEDEVSTTTTKIKRKGDFLKQRAHHKKRKHLSLAKRFKCHLCTKDFSLPYNLKVHIRSVHEGVRHKCTKCPGTFSNKPNVLKHESRVHRIGGPPTQQCKLCGIHLLKSEKSLNNHINRYHKQCKMKARGSTGGVERSSNGKRESKVDGIITPGLEAE